MNKNKSNLSYVLFIFGFVWAFFAIMPTCVPDFNQRPLTGGDLLDFFTPFAFIAAAYFLYHRLKDLEPNEEKPRKRKKNTARVLLITGFILFVDGHGIHLAANSIAKYVQNVPNSDIFRAVYLLDEVISHFMWDGGVFLISLAFIVLAVSTKQSPTTKTQSFLILSGAVLYGFTFTVNGIEGQTVLFTFPAAGLGCILSFLLNIREKNKNQVLLFFMLGYFLSLMLFAYWGISHGEFPQFSELGWI